MLIAIDHGNKQIKTVHTQPFTSGLIQGDTPGFGTDCLTYQGKYYTLTDQRIPYRRDKTEDERFFILTLFAIAYSSKSSYFDWAKIRFTEQFQPKISLARKDPAAIELGYNNVFEEVFTGYVSKPYNGGGFTDEVTLKDEMLLLEETQINNTFLDTTPQEMIAYFLGKAGLSKMKLSSKGYPERKRLPIRQMNVIEAINAVHAAWNIKQPFFFSGGVFYWGEKPEQDKTYIFEYGVNIIALTRSGGSWELETVSAPFVRHSHKISVKHPMTLRSAGGYTTSFNPKTTILCGLKSRSGRGWAFKSGRSSCPRA